MRCKHYGQELKTDVRFEPNKHQLFIWDSIVDNLKVDPNIPTLIHSKTFGWIPENAYKCELEKAWKENKDSMFKALGTVYEDMDGNIWVDSAKTKKVKLTVGSNKIYLVISDIK